MGDDEVDIRRLLLDYARRIDAGDLDGVARLFAAGTWQAAGGPVLRGTAEVRRAYDRVVLYDGLPLTRHIVTNIDIEVDHDEVGHGRTATATSYFTVMHAPPGQGALRAVMAGTYEDTFTREHGSHGAWRFASRVIHPDLQGKLSTHYR